MTNLKRLVVAGGISGAVLMGAAPVGAQGVAANFEQLGMLVRPGDKITVIDAAGTKADGRIGVLSRDTLMLTTPSGVRQLGERDIVEIRQRRGDSLLNGAIIGAAGATVWFGIGMAVFGDMDGGDILVGPAIAGGVIFAGMGAAAGAGIDALITHRYVIYRGGAAKTSVRVSPILGRGRQGAMITVRF